MDTHHIEIAVRPLSDWPDDQVLLVYRLIAADVADQLADPGPATRTSWPTPRRDAELFGVEALRRGLVR